MMAVGVTAICMGVNSEVVPVTLVVPVKARRVAVVFEMERVAVVDRAEGGGTVGGQDGSS